MRSIDLFAGVEGFRLGMEGAGHECVWSCEIDRWCQAVYRYHHQGETPAGDARQVRPDEIPDFDLLCAGFPCQSFSVAGKREGFRDPRGTLFYEICRIARAKRPRLLLLENVAGLLSVDRGETFGAILQELGDLGYGVEWQVLNSKDHGVPQNRERVFVVGHLGGVGPRAVFPIPSDGRAADEEGLHSQTTGIIRWQNKREGAVVDNTVPSLRASGGTDIRKRPMIYRHPMNYGKKSVYSPDEPHPSLRTVSRSPKVVKPCLTPDRAEKRQHGRRFKKDGEPMFTLTGQDVHGVEIAEKRVIAICDSGLHRQKQIRTDILPPLRAGRGCDRKDTVQILEVANAVDCDGYLRFGQRPRDEDGKPQLIPIGYRRIRRLTPRECERLQGFPDDWTRWGIDGNGNKFELSDAQRYRQMGNAVTVNVVEFIARRLPA